MTAAPANYLDDVKMRLGGSAAAVKQNLDSVKIDA